MIRFTSQDRRNFTEQYEDDRPGPKLQVDLPETLTSLELNNYGIEAHELAFVALKTNMSVMTLYLDDNGITN